MAFSAVVLRHLALSLRSTLLHAINIAAVTPRAVLLVKPHPVAIDVLVGYLLLHIEVLHSWSLGCVCQEQEKCPEGCGIGGQHLPGPCP